MSKYTEYGTIYMQYFIDYMKKGIIIISSLLPYNWNKVYIQGKWYDKHRVQTVARLINMYMLAYSVDDLPWEWDHLIRYDQAYAGILQEFKYDSKGNKIDAWNAKAVFEPYYFLGSNAPMHLLVRIILHEIAHILTPIDIAADDQHNEQFTSICKLIKGIAPDEEQRQIDLLEAIKYEPDDYRNYNDEDDDND